MNDNLDFWRPAELEALETFSPNLEVCESNSEFKLKFDLPGVEKEQIRINIQGNELTVTGERHEQVVNEDKTHKKLLSDIYYGSFTRSFCFPTDIKTENVQAKCDNGVLCLTVEKREPTRAKLITVN